MSASRKTVYLDADYSRRKSTMSASNFVQIADAVAQELKTQHSLQDTNKTTEGSNTLSLVTSQVSVAGREDHLLHHPRNEEHLKQLLNTESGVDIANSNGDAPIHSILKRGNSPKDRRETANLLMTLLTFSPVDVNLTNQDKMTPLHLAAQNCDLESAKILLVFGAEVNPYNRWSKTPLDLLSVHQRFSFKTAATPTMDKEAELLISTNPSLHPAGSSSPLVDRGGSSSPLVGRGGSSSPLVGRGGPSSPLVGRGGPSSPTVERTGQLSDRMRSYKLKKGLFSRSREAKVDDSLDKRSPLGFRKRADTFVELSDREKDLSEAVVVSPQEAQLVHEEGICEDSVPPDYEKLNALLVSLGAYGERTYQQHLLETRSEMQFLPKLPSFPLPCVDKQWKVSDEEESYSKCVQGDDPWVDSIPGRYKELDTHIRRRMGDLTDTVVYSTDEAFACALQLRELTLLRKSGSRVLSLDGGGMKGLIQIEVLEQIEKLTQRKITEIFDWIVGTSVGGIVALVMVYAKKTLKELRQLMFQMKDEVFGYSRGGYGCNTEALERILKEVFGDMKMDDVKYPRVMVATVDKSTTDLKLHFFNNCFDVWFGEEKLKLNKMEVWKVARYTSAGPMYFEECDSYVDGGILANNPCMEGLTRIQDYYRQLNQKLPISLVVSVGCGVYPPSTIGSIDAQRFLFFGRHWLPTSDGPGVQDTVKNLATLMSSAITESETSAKHCENSCEEQGIQYFRFSPRLERVIAPSETNNEVLFDMIISTRLQSKNQGIHKLIKQLHELSKCCRKMHRRFNCAPKF